MILKHTIYINVLISIYMCTIQYNMYNIHIKPETMFIDSNGMDQSFTFGRQCNNISFKN